LNGSTGLALNGVGYIKLYFLGIHPEPGPTASQLMSAKKKPHVVNFIMRYKTESIPGERAPQTNKTSSRGFPTVLPAEAASRSF
jgi:hypothetical protein